MIVRREGKETVRGMRGVRQPHIQLVESTGCHTPGECSSKWYNITRSQEIGIMLACHEEKYRENGKKTETERSVWV